MIRSLTRLIVVPNHRIVLINCQGRRMATKLQLKTEPGDFVQSRIKVFGETVAEQSKNLTMSIAKRTPEDPGKFLKVAQEKASAFLDIAKAALVITCERAVIVARSSEMKNALDHSLVTLQHYFFLMRRIFEEIVVIVQRISQNIRERSNQASGDKK